MLIESILKKVTELGEKVVTPKTPQGLAYRACFTDPSGNLFGLWGEKREEVSNASG
jgi:predicted enzyme related to lactoylglutathione lyase